MIYGGVTVSSSSGGLDFTNLPNGSYRTKHQENDIYTMPRGAGSTVGINPNTFRFTPILVVGSLTIKAFAMNKQSSSGTSVVTDVVNIGFYASDQFAKPTTLLHSMTHGAYFNGAQETAISPNLTLEQGLYFIGILNPSSSLFNANFFSYQGGAITLQTNQLDAFYGALQNNMELNGYDMSGNAINTLPATINQGLLVHTNVVPTVGFRVASHTL